MGKKMSINKERLYSFIIFTAVALWLLPGGAASSKAAAKTDETKTPSIQQSNATLPAEQKKDVASNPVMGTATTASQATDTAESVNKDTASSEPRIFFESSKSNLNQVLGIDFIMTENGKSRLIVTTSKKAGYALDRKDEKTLILKVYDSTIANPLLMRQIDTTQFQSALEGVKQTYSSQKNEVDLILSLREMVPFHVVQTDSSLNMDLGQTSVKVSEKKIIPLDLAETETKTLSAKSQGSSASDSTVKTSARSDGKKYTGEKMYLDFVNADVVYILQLINEVSDKNVIWDPAIAGRKVSMILKDVPWDEALDLVLDNNDLDKEVRGENVIWVATKEKIKQFKAEKEALALKQKQAAEEEEKKLRDKEKTAKEEEPLVTEYLPIDFATAETIKKHIVISKRGSMSVDTRTNTIILTDTADSVATAKKTLKQFDTPVKQIMIEARIVDASETFSRNLGIKWNSNTGAWTNSAGNLTTDTVPQNALEFTTSGETGMGGSFSTNSPDGWASNLDLSFATLASDGTGALTLDASLAIAESEGTAKTLSAPKVIAREGTAATISSGDSIIIPATENVASTTLDATLSLTVTPSSVSFNNYITIDVAVTDDSAPSTSRLIKKSIKTTLMVKSGDTVVIGGIIKESEGNDVSGVPVLKDIPGLGWLFKAKSKTKSKSELLIFLTPTVLSSPVSSKGL